MPEQYYPTYVFEDRDVVIIELREAYKEANGQSRLYTQLSSLLLGVLALILSLMQFEGTQPLQAAIQSRVILLSLYVSISIIGVLLLFYFADLQKSIALNRRKVIVLRTMLGLDYGAVRAVLPIDRVEGAVNPFMIKIFSGWFHYMSLPFWTISIFTGLMWAIGAGNLLPLFSSLFSFGAILGLWVSILAMIYRRRLFDNHETFKQLMASCFARFVNVRLVPSMEYSLYRSRLSAIETGRVGIDTELLAKIIVAIEDRYFYQHKGVQWRSIFRAVGSTISYIRDRHKIILSGGSTITMQLARTVFVVDYHKVMRRKVVEVLLAFWLETQLSKKEIIEMYIGSARFAAGIYGLPAALKHFFPDRPIGNDLSPEEAFLLAERLSAMKSTYSEARLKSLLSRTSIEVDALKDTKLQTLKQIYEAVGLTPLNTDNIT